MTYKILIIKEDGDYLHGEDDRGEVSRLRFSSMREALTHLVVMNYTLEEIAFFDFEIEIIGNI